jgi:thiamine transporter ThiT
MAIPFNRWISFAGGLVPYFLICWVWSLKAGVLFGIIGGLVGGIVGGMFFGGTESDE